MSNFRVNRNGDTADTLVRQHCAVRDAAHTLLEALAKAAPHGRNYQFEGGEEAFELDRIAHTQQVVAVKEFILTPAEDDALRACAMRDRCRS